MRGSALFAPYTSVWSVIILWQKDYKDYIGTDDGCAVEATFCLNVINPYLG
jgi:hypothetical protein